ncbi:unnamed protein product [Protopolystoma xenopodis]|uniref:Uncharacterized protein n=1 Tax=Protopolystoma xenopodis TaxID=117903 RepID=A0A3S5BJG4_9PLAT|nr:unnamed protein product [Protopolystoma xenopodis]
MLEAGLLVEEAVWRMACCAVCPDFLSPEPSPSTHVITSSEADSTTGGSFEISPALSMEQQAHIDRVFKNLASRLQLAGPSKRVTLPHGKKAREAIIKGGYCLFTFFSQCINYLHGNAPSFSFCFPRYILFRSLFLL